MGAPIIENEQLDPGELVDQSGETAIKTGHGHVLKKPWHPDIENGVVEPGSLMSKSAGQPCFAGSRLPGEDDLLMGPDPASLGERQDITSVEAATGGEVDIFDAGVREAHLCIAQFVGKALVGPEYGLAIKHEAEPFVAIQGFARVLFGQALPGFEHAGEIERDHLVQGWVCQH